MEYRDSVRLTMLGTGNAGVTKCYNTCFVLTKNGVSFLVDAGGGNTVLSRLEDVNIPLSKIKLLFLTHSHTDHIMGAVWIVRMIGQAINKGKYEGIFKIYGNSKVVDVLRKICEMTLAGKVLKLFDDRINFYKLDDGDCVFSDGFCFTCFDICSTKEEQFGFYLELGDNKRLVCLGDEPFNEKNIEQARRATWLMSEAFCLYRDREIYQPYEKHHSTALDAARTAAELDVENLIMYHTEDDTLPERKKLYTEEAASVFSGGVYVPEDCETIDLC